MKQNDKDLLFVEIPEPSATRRDVLMATKDVLDSLKRYEEYKAIKAEKQNALETLKKVADELLVLNRKLRSKLPKVPIAIPDTSPLTDDSAEAGFERSAETAAPRFARATPTSSAGPRFAREREGRIITGPAPIAARPKSKLDVLQEELEKIESRLGALE